MLLGRSQSFAVGVTTVFVLAALWLALTALVGAVVRTVATRLGHDFFAAMDAYPVAMLVATLLLTAGYVAALVRLRARVAIGLVLAGTFAVPAAAGAILIIAALGLGLQVGPR